MHRGYADTVIINLSGIGVYVIRECDIHFYTLMYIFYIHTYMIRQLQVKVIENFIDLLQAPFVLGTSLSIRDNLLIEALGTRVSCEVLRTRVPGQQMSWGREGSRLPHQWHYLLMKEREFRVKCLGRESPASRRAGDERITRLPHAADITAGEGRGVL